MALEYSRSTLCTGFVIEKHKERRKFGHRKGYIVTLTNIDPFQEAKKYLPINNRIFSSSLQCKSVKIWPMGTLDEPLHPARKLGGYLVGLVGWVYKP